MAAVNTEAGGHLVSDQPTSSMYPETHAAPVLFINFRILYSSIFRTLHPPKWIRQLVQSSFARRVSRPNGSATDSRICPESPWPAK